MTTAIEVEPSTDTTAGGHLRDGRLVNATGLGVMAAGRWIVRGVDLSVHRGEIVTLIGPNGSGKTTTARAVLGVIEPDEGQVERRRGLRVGYVPQRLQVDWSLPLSVSRFMSITARRDRAAVAQALDQVGIAHLRDSPLQTLSGGEFQRALIARALIGRPDLLVLDEPVQGVDFSGEIALYELIGTLRRTLDCGILLISHDLHIVMADTDTVICLNGHVCCSGTPEAVAGSPAYRELFGPRAAATLAVYRHEHDHHHTMAGAVVPHGDEPDSADAASGPKGVRDSETDA